MDYETIKVGAVTYKIANNSCNFTMSPTIKTVIIIEAYTIDSIYANLKSATVLIKYDKTGVIEWQKRNVKFTGNMSVEENYMVGIDQMQTGTDENNDPIYTYTNIYRDVLIVELQINTTEDIPLTQDKRLSELEHTVANILSDILWSMNTPI